MSSYSGIRQWTTAPVSFGLPVAIAVVMITFASLQRPVILAGVIGLVLISLVPYLGIGIAVLVDSVGLIAILWFSDGTSFVTLGSGVAVILAATIATMRSAKSRQRFELIAVPLCVLCVWGLAGGYGLVAIPQAAVGVRLFAQPFVVWVAAGALSEKAKKRLLDTAGLALCFSLVAALVELRVGVSGLVAKGLTYGTQVRTVDTILRPPGLFVANYVFGAYASVYCAVSLGILTRVGWRRYGLVRHAFLWASFADVILSTARFALVIVAVSVALIVFDSRSRLSHIPRVALMTTVAGAIAAFVARGNGGAASVFTRLTLWRQLFSADHSLFGAGWGTAGAAGLSRFAVVRNTTDNYYLNLFYQIGVAGILVAVLAWVLFVKIYRRRSSLPNIAYGALLAFGGILISFVFTETWEYPSAMALFMVCGDFDTTFSGRKPRCEALTETHSNEAAVRGR